MFKSKSLKTLFLVVVLVLSLSLGACGGGDATPATPDPAPVAPAAPEAPPAPAPAPAAKVTADEVALERGKDLAASRVAGESFMIAPDKAWENIQAGDIFVIDLKSEEDFMKAQIPGSYNVFYNTGEMGGLLDRIPQDKDVYIICYSGQTANQAVGALYLAGFDNVKAVTGGSGNWTKMEQPLSEGAANPLASAPVVSSPQSDADELGWKLADDHLSAVTAADKRNFIAPAALNEALQTEADKYYVVDIRAPKADNFDKGHIEGSSFYAWADIEAKLDSFPKDKKIVVACWSGNNANQIIAPLKALGYDAVSLLGGINNGWLELNKPEADRKPLPLVTP